MPNGKSSGKHSRQLLLSEAIAQPKAMVAQTAPPCPVPSPADPPTLEATDRILQEIASVGRCLEAMDLKITDLTVASSSIRADIAGFRETSNALDQRLTAVEDQVTALPDQVVELRSLRAKITDLEDRSRRDNVRFFGIREHKEGSNIKSFLKPFCLLSLMWSSHHHRSSREYTGLALSIKRPPTSPPDHFRS
ncbi:hypothetical protein NDU88_004838 [Pleurodeles waltl]|uniref:Uncharacterized protein n=1 Tax=Pleurodeles waltl TaxID=8319 RepID=A0AAV7L2K5_PLEWA|nr:hypothetical protein NDU88_004838 [Pleurodeles waltl]